MKEKINIKFTVILILMILLSGVIIWGIIDTKNEYKNAYAIPPLTVNEIKKADAKNAKKLMIVAHPDDDLLWGGGHLMDGDYLVVCVTRGYDKVRSEEFRRVIEASGNEHIILSYPDKVAGKRDDWTNVKAKISADLDRIMEYKNWDLIVTHNKDGEYGHQHHKMTHKIVTNIYEKEKIKSDFYYFGKYHKKADMDKVSGELVKLTDEQIEFKEKLMPLYDSQARTLKGLWHMADYEMWQKYDAQTRG